MMLFYSMLPMFWVLFMMFLNTCDSQVTTVDYLYGGPRIGNTRYFDYYFCCNSQGQYLNWVVNNDSILGFTSSDSGNVEPGSHSNFLYLSTLLSVRTTDPQQPVYRFDSIIIISIVEPEILDIRCESDLGRNSTRNSMLKKDKVNLQPRNDGDVLMQPLFLGEVISSSESETYGFVCRVQGISPRISPTWIINSLEDQPNSPQNLLEFGTNREVGYVLPPYRSTEPITFNRLATIYAVDSSEIITVLFVTGNGNMNVTCSAGGYRARISTDEVYNSAMISSQTSINELPTSGNFSTSLTAADEEEVEKNVVPSMDEIPGTFVALQIALPVVLAVVIIVLVTVAVAVVVTISIVLMQRRKKNSSKVKDSEEVNKDDADYSGTDHNDDDINQDHMSSKEF